MIKILGAAFICGLLAFLVFGSDALKWTSFSEGLELARKDKKYIFMDFSADWCTYCRLFENTTLTHPEVIKELLNNFISIKVDTDSQDKIMWEGQPITFKSLGTKLGISELPTLVFSVQNRDDFAQAE